jgi:type IV secretory pathway VirB2 component (pilin)
MSNSRRYVVATILFALFLPVVAHASGSGMPWESWLQKVLDSISGPVAKIIGAIVIILSGLGMASGEGGAGARKWVMVAFGLSIAFTASSFFLSFLGFSGGVAF